MTKFIAALLAGAVACGPKLTLADDNDSKPLSKMETQEAKAARDAAKAKWDAMTPEQQAAAKKAARNKKLSDANALDMIANENMQFNSNGRPLMGGFGLPAPLPPARQRP
jgi:hypothetical protein